MRLLLDKFYRFLDRPIYTPARVALLVLLVPLVLSFFWPLWNIHLTAPQYPKGLDLFIYLHTVEGGNEGQHIDEINMLNHYIGMAPITRDSLKDLDWMPFAIGVLILLTLRVAVLGNVRSLMDLTVLTTYFSLFAFGRFYYQMYSFGHNLDPTAPIKLEPFTPVIIGTKKIANFTTSSYPQFGSVLFGIFVVGLLALMAWHLISGRQEAVRATESTTDTPATTP